MMTPKQRAAFSRACATLNKAGLPDMSSLLSALHLNAAHQPAPTTPGQQKTADVTTWLLDLYRTQADMQLATGAVVLHLPEANGSSKAVLRSGLHFDDAEWDEFVSRR